jgi:hypothetical protein
MAFATANLLIVLPALFGTWVAALFGSTVLTLPFLFDLFWLPADLFQVFITVDVIASRFGALLAGMHIVAIALLATDPRPFDAVLMPAEEGASWTSRHPRLSLVTPSPTLLTPFAYSVQIGDSERLPVFNAWLLNVQGDGTIDSLYGILDAGRTRQDTAAAMVHCEQSVGLV